jgi:hypothetical protein
MSTTDKDRQDDNEHTDLGRRSFMRRAGAGAGAVAVGGVMSAGADAKAREPQRTAKTKGVDYDVIVLGGGFAGVTAARDSSKNGYKTLVLEARDRLGGRTWTKEFAGHKVEMGGTWVHWTQPFVWSEVQRYKLEVIETPDNVDRSAPQEVVVLVDGRREYLDTPEKLSAVFGAFYKYFGDAGSFWERPYDAPHQWQKILGSDKVTAGQVLQKMDLTPTQRVALEAYMAGLTHSGLDQSSHIETSRWWALPGGTMSALSDAGGRYRFKDGTVSLINKMVEDGKPEIRLSTPVKSVDDRGDHVVVTTATGQRFTAATVIVGLPMNVLANVQFSPALDPKLVEAGRERHAGSGIKLLTKIKGHLAKPRVVALASPTHPLPLTTTYTVGDDHTLLVTFGPDPKRIDYSDKAAVQTALRDFFPDAVVEELHHQPWTEDPYARGTWANYKPGWFKKYYEHFRRTAAACSSAKVTTAKAGGASSMARSAPAAARPCASKPSSADPHGNEDDGPPDGSGPDGGLAGDRRSVRGARIRAAGKEAQHPAHPRGQPRLRRTGRLRRRGDARRSDAAHRQARRRGPAPHQHEHGAAMHAQPLQHVDGALCHSLGNLCSAVRRHGGRPHAMGSDDGRVAVGRRICDRAVRQVASRQP